MADEYLGKIKAITKNNDAVVHIMGNDFCYALIQKLQKENIKCVASTTKRKVRVLPTGEELLISILFNLESILILNNQ